MIRRILFVATVLAAVIYMVHQMDIPEDQGRIMLDRSGPHVGADIADGLGYRGHGITVAVIDTGVSTDHPDLRGSGTDIKIAGGVDFVDGGAPEDINGHGTQVAGIIAADGEIRGIAPDVRIVPYRVSEDGESVSSDLIIRAIRQAIDDGVDVINISLGVNRTNPRINAAISEAVDSGIVVVAAAGNDGPGPRTIGSPGISRDAITVGATYNNVSSSLVATLDVNGKRYNVLPMTGTQGLSEPVTEDIFFGGYARRGEIAQLDGQIVLAERGSDIEGQLVYFSQKETNAAEAGASAIIIYNNEDGIFLGELLHDFMGSGYRPEIPALSMSREDGLEIRGMLDDNVTARLHVFYNPDHIAHFSSRGPVSPFYSKPDIVAPGIFVNTTSVGDAYNFSSGTSFATPHVSGAAAVLLERHPGLGPHQIKSILMTTSSVITDAYGTEFPVELAGSGRLDIGRALGANLVIAPPMLSFSLSDGRTGQTKVLDITPFDGLPSGLEIEYDIPDGIGFDAHYNGGQISAGAALLNATPGSFQGRMLIDDGSTTYNIPVLFDVTEGTVFLSIYNGRLNIDVRHPGEWSYAKIAAINSDTGREQTASAFPGRGGVVSLDGPGTYWIEAVITTANGTSSAYGTITTDTAGSLDPLLYLGVPLRPMLVLVGVIAAISLIGAWFARTRRSDRLQESRGERL